MAIIINGRGRVGARPSSGGGTPAPSYLLDTYSGAAVAYSLRKLSSTYNGSAIRVRRSSDNTEMNIGFNSDGSLNTSALLTFVGGGSGYVTTWYDQSGNKKNATRTVASDQPIIVSSGSIVNDSSLPCINFDSYRPLLTPTITYSSAFTIAHVTTQTTVNYLLGSSTGGIIYNGSLYGAGANFGAYDGSNFRAITGGNLNRNLGYFNMKTSKLFVSLNNSSDTDTGSFSTSLTLGGDVLNGVGGRDVGIDGLYFKGKIQEIILFTSEQSANKSGINTNINNYYSIYTPLDSDAAAFVSAAGITNSTQMSAVNTLVTSLKSSGVWNKMKAIYPVVGGNATAHSKNLKNPSQYNLTFSSGWSHSSNGMTPNGSAYASTSLIPRSVLSTNSTHISYYSRTNKLGSNECEMGTNQVQNEKKNYMCYDAYNTNYIGVNQYGDSTGTRLPNTLGMLLLSRNDSTQFNKFFNNSKEVITHHNSTTTHPLAGTATKQMTLGCIRDGDTTNRLYSTKECAFSTIGDGLTDSEASAFYTAVQAFQTTLGRQV
jgi:hypothetical protein